LPGFSAAFYISSPERQAFKEKAGCLGYLDFSNKDKKDRQGMMCACIHRTTADKKTRAEKQAAFSAAFTCSSVGHQSIVLSPLFQSVVCEQSNQQSAPK